jgi:protein SCO1/2
VVLALVYDECPMLCSLVLSGLVGSLRAVTPSVGEAFDVLVVSFDPKDTPETSRKKKERTLARYGRPGSDVGFHFLTGDPAAIAAVTRTVGFRYERDPSTGQYAHPAGVVVLMPDGTVARYLYGSEFSPRDLQLATVEASQGKKSLTNQLLMLCYRYDPQRGTYSWAALGALRVGGGLTAVLLGAFVIVSIRRERRKDEEAPK